MATLKLYTDKTARSHLARKHLDDLGVSYDEIYVEEDQAADLFLESKGRDRKHYPLPQYYVNNQVAFEGGYKDVVRLSSGQINSRIEELNAG